VKIDYASRFPTRNDLIAYFVTGMLASETPDRMWGQEIVARAETIADYVLERRAADEARFASTRRARKTAAARRAKKTKAAAKTKTGAAS
jgi:hypothetical protein